MDKINKETSNVINENQKWLQEKFPSCFVEGKLDFDKLKELTSEFTHNSNDEKYSFSWAGRTDSIKNIQTPTHGTLIPQKDESINFDGTENIFIEGENLEVLKLLQKSYSNKIKMVYIDPPYNTGKDFIYKDDFSNSLDSYLQQTGQKKEGIKLTSNPETSGRFHSDWISFMYPRLFLARELLKDDGVIFVSIDNREIHNLRLIMNDIFGEENFLTIVANVNNPKGRSDDKFFPTSHEYLVVYQKNCAIIHGWVPEENILNRYNKKDDQDQKYREIDLRKTGDKDRKIDRPNLFYPFYYDEHTGKIFPSNNFTIPEGLIQILPFRQDGVEGRWRWGLETAKEKIEFLFPKYMPSGKRWSIFEIDYFVKDKKIKPTTSWTFKDINSERGSESFIELGFKKEIFDNPKPLGLIKRIIDLVLLPNENDIILDFFVGSGSTAQSLYELNKNDLGIRKFICVQIPEQCNEKSDAYKSGYKTIADISKERIRRVIKKINDETKQQKLNSKQNQDLGFKVFKLTKSNYKVWQDVKDEAKLKEQLKLFEDPLVENYKDIDVIYEIIIKEGYSLNSEIKEVSETSNKIYKVTDDEFFFFVTLDKTLDEKSLDSLNLDKNTMFVCLDSAINDSQKTNLDKLCKLRTI